MQWFYTTPSMRSTNYARNTMYACTVVPVSIRMAAPNIIPDILIYSTTNKNKTKTRHKHTFGWKQNIMNMKSNEMHKCRKKKKKNEN